MFGNIKWLGNMVRNEPDVKLKRKKTARMNEHIKNQIGMKTFVLVCQDKKKLFQCLIDTRMRLC